MHVTELVALVAVVLENTNSLRELRRHVNGLLIDAELKRELKTRHRLTAACLGVPHLSAWSLLYKYGTDENLLNVTTLTRSAFNELLARFAGFYHIHRPRRDGGRPPKLTEHHQVLGLLLHYYEGSMGVKTICEIFAVPPTTLQRTLMKAEHALEAALRGFYPARISWPSLGHQRRMAAWVHAREPLLDNIFGFVDGKNYRVMQPSRADIQNAYYNGWLHAVFVTGTICFGADGCILWAKHNCPGSWNDADTSLELREKLLDTRLCPDQSLGVVSDSAFPSSAAMRGRILTPLKDGDLDRLLPSVRSSARRLNNAITSVRQAAEWGMGSIEKVYHRLLLPLPYDPERRRLQLSNMFRLANYRVRTTGISQIRTIFSQLD
ncbi:hypothetical protein F441_03681 [Phytophthora nicotianae CJ01A1]|uniref:DDE Tnp4 domain-containing protein n=2 Tax=Phytophthora nicotianae TaxID=4792 RepID=W2XKH4_PHYNI|nr:hypothetical protein F441_03681 [Phytophthora nicotianae CJ01A1]